jgi:hypothetical protein
MKTVKLFAALVMFAACAKSTGPKTETFPGRQLGESTASPGSNPSRPQPLTPDDPRVMNVSAGITPAQAQAAARAPLPTTTVPVTTQTQQPATSSQTVRAPSTPDPATSSTPVTQPTDIAPATTTPDGPRPGVFSPPPPPPQ